MRTLAIPIEWRDRALVLAGGEPDDSWFSTEELQVAAGFKLEKRRREWKLSRMAAKELAVRQGRVALHHEWSAAIPGGAFVSLSHSAPYAGAAIDDQPIGLDVQVVQDLADGALHFFLTDDEQALMRRCGIPEAAIHFWCAKEAEWKRRGGEILTLKRVPLHFTSANATGAVFDEVETRRIGDVVVALTRRAS